MALLINRPKNSNKNRPIGSKKLHDGLLTGLIIVLIKLNQLRKCVVDEYGIDSGYFFQFRLQILQENNYLPNCVPISFGQNIYISIMSSINSVALYK